MNDSDFWAEQPATPAPKPAPEKAAPKAAQLALFAEADRFGTAAMFGDEWGTGEWA